MENIETKIFLKDQEWREISIFWTRYRKPNTEDAVEHYYKISEKFDLDMSQMSIKFCEIQDFMTSVIIGATTMEQLKTNIESVNVNLNSDIINDINKNLKKYGSRSEKINETLGYILNRKKMKKN